MTGFEHLEEVVHVVVAKPIAWTLFLIWLAAKFGWRWTRFGVEQAVKHGWRWTAQFSNWVRSRYMLHARRKTGRRSQAV